MKHNNNNSISFCDECPKISNYLKHKKDVSLCTLENYEDSTSHCEKCLEMYSIEKAISIIKSCVKSEHFDVAMKYVDQYLKTFSNSFIYIELIELMEDRKKEINF